MALFSTMQLDRDNKIKELDQKVSSVQSTNTALQEEISDIKETTEHQFSVLRDEISSLKSRIKSQENAHSAHFDSLSEKIDSNEHYEWRDALILFEPLVPLVSDCEDCDQLFQRLFRDDTQWILIFMIFQLLIALFVVEFWFRKYLMHTKARRQKYSLILFWLHCETRYCIPLD